MKKLFVRSHKNDSCHLTVSDDRIFIKGMHKFSCKIKIYFTHGVLVMY